MAAKAVEILVRGVVQGVGFRPFVYRLAGRLGLSGWVSNDGGGVRIHAEETTGDLARFEILLAEQAPGAAAIDEVTSVPATPAGLASFRILPCRRDGAERGATRVPPDRAACPDCRREAADPDDRRHGYALTTCTDCGPRYSILRRMPFDRPDTTMSAFPLCPACQKEYDDPDCRRFHAQSIACSSCGPRVALWGASGRPLATDDDAVRAAAHLLRAGGVLALKGLGGFQLLARADSSEAVGRLRSRKARRTKPFAVMVPTLAAARGLARIGTAEEELLTSPVNPVVLLRRREGAESRLAPEVAPRLGEVGLMLPATPLHHLLLSAIAFPVVATSGNAGGEPIAIDESEARERLRAIADGFLVHDRPIARRVDDSVVRVVAGRPLLMRLARGYAPLPLPALERWARRHLRTDAPPALAVGGQQKAALALYAAGQAVLGPHIGDLDDPLTRRAFAESARDLPGLYGREVGLVACDLHPDYASARWAEESDLPVVRVQHHHAHAAACMVEHDLLDREVFAFTWDGTGLGPDGTVWGGEVLRARLDGFDRVAHLRPFVLPGGEAAIREPNRVALALLVQAVGDEAVLADPDLPVLLGLSEAAVRLIVRMILRGVNCPVTTSMGRLFDAVAALALGAAQVSYEGEAAAWLESVAEGGEGGEYPLPLTPDGEGDWRPLVRAVLADRKAGVAGGMIAGRFHDAVIGWAAEVAARFGGLPVVLGGGCFQNARLAEGLTERLRGAGHAVYPAGAIPPGDGGLAAGQLAVALAWWVKNKSKEVADVSWGAGTSGRAAARG